VPAVTTSAMADAMKIAEKKRMTRLKEIQKDPYIGYENLDQALEEYKLNSQAEVLARLINRENVFISGPAGSGKTTIINRFQDIIDAQFHGKFEIALTASTGIAATLLGGVTIHSWAGLGIDQEVFDPRNVSGQLAARRTQMRTTDVLVIDEISMLPAYLFTKLDAVLKWARMNDKPFGGIQLILTGDFLQLPPVSRPDDKVDTGYAITTQTWKEAEITCCYMDKTHRATDQNLKYLLAAIASGKAKEIPKARDLVKSRSGGRDMMDPEKAYTTLFTTNQNVDKFNLEELAKNKNIAVTSKMEFVKGSKEEIAKAVKKFGVPAEFTYKVGATVMLTSNMVTAQGDMLANGSIGVVKSVIHGIPRVHFNSGITISVEKKSYIDSKKLAYKDPISGKEVQIEVTVAEVKQLPLRLGYAITVHRSQGQTLDGVICDLSKVFTSGLGYVALSRVRSMDDLIITGWTDRAYNLDPLSRKIANYVKRQALKTREDFIAKREDYEMLLADEYVRIVMWDESESYKLNGVKKGPLDLR